MWTEDPNPNPKLPGARGQVGELILTARTHAIIPQFPPLPHWAPAKKRNKHATDDRQRDMEREDFAPVWSG